MTSEHRSSMFHIALALGAACALAACQNMTAREQGTATGADISAIFGAIIGSNSGDASKGAVIGTVGDAVAGNLWSEHMKEERQVMETATEGTGDVVARTDDNQLKINMPLLRHTQISALLRHHSHTATRSQGRCGRRPVGGVLSATGIGPTPLGRFAVIGTMAQRLER